MTCDEPIPTNNSFYTYCDYKSDPHCQAEHDLYNHKCCNGEMLYNKSRYFRDIGECEIKADSRRSYTVFTGTSIATMVFSSIGIVVEVAVLFLFLWDRSILTEYGVLCVCQSIVDILILIVIGFLEMPIYLYSDTK